MYHPHAPPLPHQPGHPQDEQYGAHPHVHHYAQGYPMQHAGYIPYPLPGTILSAPMAPPSQNGGNLNSAPSGVPVAFMDDAATKLSDRTRVCGGGRICLWGKSCVLLYFLRGAAVLMDCVHGKLCNKCGLFERTHSRPRPEQFPHKRGPLGSSTLSARSPPQPTYQQPQYNPLSASTPRAPSSQPLAPTSSSSRPPQNGSASRPGTPAPHAPGASSAASTKGENDAGSPRECEDWRGDK
ncbi:hypothetical protein FB451DRAFT_1172698 [Mycena latifolia]|nr:hypothetical protein FB451DRAFT_1172698 [Mycena latifolia]